MAKTKKMTPGMAYVLRLKEQQRQRANAVSFTPTDLEREDLSKQAGRPVTDAEIIRGNIHGPAPQFAPVFPKPQPRTDYDDEIREAEEEVLREAESKLSAAQKRLLHAQRKAAEQIQQQAAAENRQAYIQAVAPQLRELHVIRDRAAFSAGLARRAISSNS